MTQNSQASPQAATASGPERIALPLEEASCLFCSGNAKPECVAEGRDFEYDSSPQRFSLLRCANCELMYLQPRPAAAAMSTIYPPNYYAYNEEEGEVAFVKFFRDRIERVKVRNYQRLIGSDRRDVLDIGSGDGRLLEIIRRFGPTNWQLAGIEIGEGAADKARAKGFEVKSGDFEFAELEDWNERFDFALMHHVIEHVRDPRATLRKVRNLLKPGAYFSVETPDLRGWDARLFGKRYWGGYHIPRHFYLFQLETLSRLLHEEGFEVVSARSIPSPAFWIFSIHNWLMDRKNRWGPRLARHCQPQNLLAVCLATGVDAIQLLAKRQSSNLQVIARRPLAPASE